MKLLARALALLLALTVGFASADVRMLLDQGGTATLRALSPAQQSRVTLLYDPVLTIDGDSQGLGTARAEENAAFKAAYVVTPQVQLLNAAGAWVPYNPARQPRRGEPLLRQLRQPGDGDRLRPPLRRALHAQPTQRCASGCRPS